MQSRGNRQQIIIHAKIAHHETIRATDSRFAVHRARVTPDDIRHDVRETLRRLKTDFLDICTLHRDDPDQPVGPIIDCLAEEQASSRIRAFGASNWSIQRIEEANAYAQAHGIPGFTVSSPNLALAYPNEPHWPNCVTACDPSSRQWYGKNNLPLFAWSSLAMGFFSGENRPLQELTTVELQTLLNDWRTRDMVRVYFSDRNFQRLSRANELAKQRGVSATLIALAWVLHQPMNTFALVGPRTEKELEELFQVFSISLTLQEIAWLNLERTDQEVTPL